MSYGPPPSQLCLLSAVPSKEFQDKVRFAGCVIHYSTENSCLTLGHLYPPGTHVTVGVDVQATVHTLSSDMMRTGEWLNVIGYVQKNQAMIEKEATQNSEPTGPMAYVQAIAVWQMGSFDIQQYEECVVAGQDSSRTQHQDEGMEHY